MTQLIRYPLPYYGINDALHYFSAIKHLPWPVLLDSAGQDRYDILSADPIEKFEWFAEQSASSNCFDALRSLIQPYQQLTSSFSTPFSAGLIGYWGYDLARELELLPSYAKKEISLPDSRFGLYDWSIVIDHHKKCTYLYLTDLSPNYSHREKTLLSLLQMDETSSSKDFYTTQPPQANVTHEAYLEKIAQIKTHLTKGDCYQINFAQRFHVPYEGDEWALYQTLRQKNPMPFSAFLSYPDGKILSASPERFLKIRHGQVETKPIKGTRPRDPDPIKDLALAKELMSSEKDQAENLMIVDLLRNDLGKTAFPGSVKVPELFKLESFSSVHHLVSTVVSKLREDVDSLACLKAAFPGGSITGAPKKRAMEIIESLEPHRRHLYCGAIGYLNLDDQMDTNIAIRTIIANNKMLYYSGGGGIVLDSEAESEYQETLDKLSKIQSLFQ